MTTPTTHFGFGQPTVGGDSGAWGGELNSFMQLLDSDLYTIQQLGLTAFQTAGGTFTGLVNVLNSTTAAVSASTGSSYTMNLANSLYFVLTVSATVTLAFSNVPATSNAGCAVFIRLINGGAFPITWPASVKWPAGTQPGWTASGTDTLCLVSDSAGTTWYCSGYSLNIH